jgi:hypothetical protein
MVPHLEDGDWQSIAEQTSKEMDPRKLMSLIAKLCRALDVEHERKGSSIRHSA